MKEQSNIFQIVQDGMRGPNCCSDVWLQHLLHLNYIEELIDRDCQKTGRNSYVYRVASRT